jgi:mannose-6-phosphate isomerase-like protein (cupin superfamily)
VGQVEFCGIRSSLKLRFAGTPRYLYADYNPPTLPEGLLMPAIERRSFLQLVIAALPFTVFGQSSQAKEPTGGLVGAGEDRFAKKRPIPTGSSTFKVSTQDSRGDFFAMEHTNQKKGGPPRHLHHNEDEWFYVIEGDYLVEVGSHTHRLKAGDSVLGPRGTSHAWAFVGNTPGRLLITYAPAGKMEEFFDSRDRQGGRTTYVTDAAAMRAYGMELLGPPLSVE